MGTEQELNQQIQGLSEVAQQPPTKSEGGVEQHILPEGIEIIKDPDQRAKKLIDDAITMSEMFGCPVFVNVEGKTSFIIKPKKERVIFTTLPNGLNTQEKNKKPKQPQKQGKTHDLTGFTGFYKGRYYDNGTARPPKNDNRDKNGKNGGSKK